MYSSPIAIEEYYSQDNLYYYFKSSISKLHLYKPSYTDEEIKGILLLDSVDFGPYGHVLSSVYSLIEIDDDYKVTNNIYSIDPNSDFSLTPIAINDLESIYKIANLLSSDYIDRLFK
jgi:hypothetical protein